MNEVILLLLTMVGIFSLACSVALLALGKMIDLYPVGDETHRTRSITSPVESTRIAVALFWGSFIPGAWAVLQEGILTKIIGVTVLFAICLFMFTALVFSFAVLSAMKGRKETYGETIIPTGAPESVITAQQTTAEKPTATYKQRNNPLSNMMVHALLKK